jgi:hypothetical protein
MLLWVARIALVLAAVSAVVLARLRADHRIFATFFGWMVCANAIRAVLAANFDLVRPLGSPPFVGVARVAFHVDQAIELSWSAGLAAVAILLFARRRWPAVLVCLLWVGAVAYLSTHYPAIRGDSLRRVYLGTELAALAVAGAAIITWTWRREPPTPARVCVLCVCLVDVVTLFAGAWRWGFWDHWNLQQAAFALLYSTLTIYQVITWRLLLSQSSSG